MLSRAVDVSAPVQSKPGVAEVVYWTKQGLAPEVIIDRLRQTSPRIRMDGATMARMRSQDVDAAVLDHLVEADRRASDTDIAEETARRLTAEAKLREQEQARLRLDGAHYRTFQGDPWQGGYDPRFGGRLIYRHDRWR